jgi:hypothetical protein
MIAQVCHHPYCSQVEKSSGCLTSEHTATLSHRCHHPYCSQLEKAAEVCLATHEEHVASDLKCLCPLSRVG